MGTCDARYLRSDSFLVTGDGVLALVAGPLALYYAWATFIRHSSGHLIGVIAACILIYTEVLYYAIEFQSNFEDISTQNLPVFIPVFIIINMMRIIFPTIVLWIESQTVLNKLQVADEIERSSYSQLHVRSKSSSLLDSNIGDRSQDTVERGYRPDADRSIIDGEVYSLKDGVGQVRNSRGDSMDSAYSIGRIPPGKSDQSL